ncbi:hypothetical protein A4R35_05665 [Thermogemmatispora tikiterensis]|uniref:Uncharacterized protein n=1 Tax=Thermogemmatispora tikiterensis TaxID=1825093 RepID=A0A328VIV9_9CHLR|nr:hypothetical protein A4R35_05665 [Thermogemmatispora tikiterensis]
MSLLPECVVGVLVRGRLDVWRRLLTKAPIEVEEFREQDTLNGVAIADNVMNNEDKPVQLWGKMEQADMQQGSLGEIEREASLLLDEGACGGELLGRRQRREVGHRKRERGARLHHLHRGAVECRERRSPEMVPIQKCLQTLLKSDLVQVAGNLNDNRGIVDSRIGL